MFEQARNAMIVRMIACVLCAFLIGDALDARPDPPAVTQHTQHGLASQVDQSGRVPAALLTGSLLSLFPRLECNLCDWHFSESAAPCIGLVWFSHATDTS